MTTFIQWTRGVSDQNGGMSFASRYGTLPTPSGIFQSAEGAGSGQANQDFESAFTLASGGSLVISLVGANGETDQLNRPLGMTIVKGVELVITSPAPASGISLLLGPQGVSDAAQLFFGGVTADFAIKVQNRFACLDAAAGWTISGSDNLLPIQNPSTVSVSGWLRVIGVNPSL